MHFNYLGNWPRPDWFRKEAVVNDTEPQVEGTLEWVASIGAIIAATLVAIDLGRRVTGWGFVLFCAVSILWIYSGLTSNAMPLAIMNAILLVINAWGVWRYLIRKEPQPAAQHEAQESR